MGATGAAAGAGGGSGAVCACVSVGSAGSAGAAVRATAGVGVMCTGAWCAGVGGVGEDIVPTGAALLMECRAGEAVACEGEEEADATSVMERRESVASSIRLNESASASR